MNDVLVPAQTVTELASPRRKRWPRVVGILSVVVLALGIGLVIALNRYSPLEHGFVFGLRGADSTQGDDFSGHTSVLLAYDHGREFWYTFGLTNAGRWGVTVTDVPVLFGPGSGFESPIQQLEVRMAPRNDDLDAGQRLSLEPFSLGPGETRLIHIRARFWNCQVIGRGGSMSFDSQDVGFSVLGLSRTMEVVLNEPLVIRSEDVVSCPPRPGIVLED